MLKGVSPPAAAATHFLLSGEALPAVFKNENLLRGYWEFVNCDTDAPQERAEEPTALTDDQDRAANALLSSNAYYLAPDAKIITPQEFEDFAKALRDSIIGQPEAVQHFVDAARLAVFSTRELDDKRPRAIFLLVGPSGVGKTEICRRLSKSLPGYGFTQINLAEYATDSAVDKLIGLGRGYVDSEMGGLLTEPVRRHPRQVILFDELDHADQSVLQLFYKLFEGEIMDGRGRTVSFRDCFIVLTTNQGVVDSPEHGQGLREEVEAKLMEVRNPLTGQPQFTPAFLGRIRTVIQFRSLDVWDYVRIADAWLSNSLRDVLRRDGAEVEVRPTAQPGLMQAGWLTPERLLCEIFALRAILKPEQGARNLIRLVEDVIIHRVLLARLKHQQRREPRAAALTIGFKPFLPDDIDGLDYEETTFLLIDDDPDAAAALYAKIGNPTCVTIKRVDFDIDQVKTSLDRVSVVLLDLMRPSDSKAGLRLLPDLPRICGDRPICIYSELPEGPLFDALQTTGWQYGVAEFLSKSEKPEVVLSQLKALLQRRYAFAKAKSRDRVGRPELALPAEKVLAFELSLK
jgi:hypothetical protein